MGSWSAQDSVEGGVQQHGLMPSLAPDDPAVAYMSTLVWPLLRRRALGWWRPFHCLLVHHDLATDLPIRELDGVHLHAGRQAWREAATGLPNWA